MIYEIPKADIELLESYCREELMGVPVADRTLPRTERVKMLERHGEAAAEALLRHHFPNAKIENANDRRTNQPGYDLLVDGRLKVQVKGRCWVELIDLAAPPLSKAAAWDSDLWLAVDFGPLIDGRWGRLALDPDVRPRGEIDFYILPTPEVRRLVVKQHGRDFTGRVRLWAGKVEKYRRRKGNMPELFRYRNAFDRLSSVI